MSPVMPNRRDIVSITCYGLLFAAVVLWAELRPASRDPLNTHEPTRAAMIGGQIALSADQSEMRRLVNQAKIP
jgi:hypothetical protein